MLDAAGTWTAAPRIGCVVMAAGASRRFGKTEPKLLLPLGGKPLLQHAIDTAAASLAASCTLVLGSRASRILDVIETRRCAVVENANWRKGLSTSLLVGLSRHRDDDACIFMVADQPFVTCADLNALIMSFSSRRRAIVALRAHDIWGTPLLFPHEDFGTLQKMRGDLGAKRYAERHRPRVIFVDASQERAFADIDTAEDYQRAIGFSPAR